jgi:hypothetical protein
MSTAKEPNMTGARGQAKDRLNGVEPVGKSRRFRLLLPVVIAKIEGGVEHAEIIKALAEEGLELTPGTYFSYLKRYRPAAATKPQAKASTAPALGAGKLEGPEAASTAVGATSTRPKTFDYDPRGIHPDLLR